MQYDARSCETVSETEIDGVEAVIVLNAALEGLPPGVVSNELLVANGSRFFSLILSTAAPDLAPIWDGVLASVTIVAE